jgi:pimeloyl-ACP methyl ester carboxylesterase
VGEASVFVRHGGDGPPVVLLHGHPRTSATWHRVAPRLIQRGFTVVCPDLRGYGQSRAPAPTPDHTAHSKRAAAADLMAVMRALGHRRFALAGHDRGGCVALRLALDHPAAVSRLALLDCIPVSEHLSRITAEFATRYWHWFFFAQPEIPERVINADPDHWYRGDPEAMGQENELPETASGRRCSCCGHNTTISRICTAIRSRSGESGPRMYVATASTLPTTWPRKHPKNLLQHWAVSSSLGRWLRPQPRPHRRRPISRHRAHGRFPQRHTGRARLAGIQPSTGVRRVIIGKDLVESLVDVTPCAQLSVGLEQRWPSAWNQWATYLEF